MTTTESTPIQPTNSAVAVPPDEDKPASPQRASGLHTLSLPIIAGPLAMIAVDMLAGLAGGSGWFIAMVLFLAAGLSGQALLRAGQPKWGAAALLLLLAAGYVALVIVPAVGGSLGALTALSAVAWLGVLSVAAGTLLGLRAALVASVVGVILLAPSLVLAEWTTDAVSWVDILLIGGSLLVFAYLLYFSLRWTAEAWELARAAREELEQTRLTLQGQVEERTQALALAAAVGRQITRIQSLDMMLTDAVNLIRERFQLYHVQVYLLSPTTQELILHAGTGEAGAELLRRNHRLPVGPGSINGTAAAGREPIVVPYARKNPMFLANPLLPETQSEMAVPIIFEDQVIGTLNLQSSVPGSLGANSLEAFTVLAAQLATAVENARLFTEVSQTREQLARRTRELTREGWSHFVTDQPVMPIIIDAPAVDADANRLRQPIPVHGTAIGYLEVGTAGDSPRARELVAAVAGQLGAHLENLRLMQQAEVALREAQHREEELALINRIVTAIAASTDLQASLQLIVDYLAESTGIQQVGVAILNEERTGLTVVADRSGQLNTDSAVGFVIPRANNPATEMALAERRPVVVPNATENPLTASAHDVLRQRGVKTILILPLVVENEAIGTVGLDVVEEGIELSDDQLRLAETIVYQAASAIHRARLFDQTEEARRDAERLFALSAGLNAAQNADDIVVAIVSSGLGEDATSVSLAAVESDTDGRPRWSTIAASWVDPANAGHGYAPGERFHLPDIDIGRAWATGRSEPVLIEDVMGDERIEGMLRALYESMSIQATVLLPLRVRDSWVGLVEMGWAEPRRFTPHDLRIFRSMATQLAVTLSNQQLVEEVRARSRHLEILSRIEAELSLATTEEEILAALAGGLPWSDPPSLELAYLSTLPDGQLQVELAGRAAGTTPNNHPVPLSALPLSGLWLDKPRELLVIESAWRDSRLDKAMRLQLENEGRRGVVIMPLRRAGQWQGVVTLSWPDSHELTNDELFILRRLHEPLAATVASRRAYLAQQAALARTEAALADQARLSGELRAVSDVSVAAAATLDVDRLLAAAADLTKENFSLYHTHIYLMDDDKKTLSLRAGAGEVGREMVREGRFIPIGERSIVARSARERDVVLVRDTRRSTDFLPHALLPDTRSEMAIPLLIGDRLLGVLDVQSDQVGYFLPEDRQVYKILAAQLAVATQNALYFAEQLEMAEKLREVDRLKTDFLARMSHELRTPLNSIIGFADVLLMGLDGDLTERMIEDLQLIRSGGYHLRDIIGDILDMSKIEAGRLELIYEEFDVRRVASELMATAAPLAEQKGLDLRLEIAEGIEPLMADRTRIRQVLWNIIGNAIKFTDHGGITVSVCQDGNVVQFSVADTGIGINPDNQARIFEYFSQVDAGRRESISGTGLGLSISKSLVEYHGGQIWVESEPGHGSTFRFSIPLQPEGAAHSNGSG